MIKSIVRPITGFLYYIMWPLVMILSLIGSILEEGIGFHDTLFWLSVAVISIQHTLSKVVDE